MPLLATALTVHAQQPVKDASVEEMVDKLSAPRATRGMRNIVPQARPTEPPKTSISPSTPPTSTDRPAEVSAQRPNAPAAEPVAATSAAAPSTTAAQYATAVPPSAPLPAPVLVASTESKSEGGQLDLVIQFDFDSANLQSASKPLLKKLAAAMNNSRLSSVSFMVEGHTDRKGSASYNDSLSRRRAESVVTFLKSNQVDAGRLQSVGKGFSELLVPDQPEAAENRRVRIMAVSSNPSQVIWLITPEEAARSQAVAMAPGIRAVSPAAGPKIVIASPEISRPVTSPTRIQVKFETQAPASVRPETFKVRYGAFSIDITDRILASSKVTAQGLEVSDVNLPKGTHSLALEIKDSLGRTGQQDIRFVVE